MLVKFIDPLTQSNETRLNMIGKTYVVLSVEITPDGRPNELLIENSKGGTPGLFEFECFEILDNRIPSKWVLEKSKPSNISFTPEELAGDFWDRYYEDHPDTFEAIDTLKAAIKKIEAFHGIKN